MEGQQQPIIVKLSPDDWQSYKGLSLKALKEEPAAFGKSFEEELETTENQWREKLREAEEGKRKWLLFAKNKDTLVGMVGAYTEKEIKVEHIANIVGMYVAPEARGRGVASELLKAILKEIGNNPKVVKISLRVNTRQTHAIKLYEAHDFKKVAQLEKELNIEGDYQDEYEMCLFT